MHYILEYISVSSLTHFCLTYTFDTWAQLSGGVGAVVFWYLLYFNIGNVYSLVGGAKNHTSAGQLDV
jgi:hypothetical protein